MKLVLKNVGKVQNAAVEINGITVIAGENDTGKSTVGKALFSVFNSFYNIDRKIMSERANSIDNQLFAVSKDFRSGWFFLTDYSELTKEIISLVKQKKSEEELRKKISDIISEYNKKKSNTLSQDAIDGCAERIARSLLIPDEEILKTVLQKNMDAEFRGQIGNVFYEAESLIRLVIQNENVEVKFLNNKIADLRNPIRLGTETIYMDDPFVLDELTGSESRNWTRMQNYLDHRAHLEKCLTSVSDKHNVVDEIVANKKLEQIYQTISTVCEGDVVDEKHDSVGYHIGNQRLEVRNMSTGLKTFAILKRLLTNGCIEMNGTIILDEPEIHLHPEWQLVFAELIVLLHKEFGLHILLNTHSPYFLNAIEVYAAKYQVTDKCKYYMMQSTGKTSEIEDVSDNIEKIYRKLARPLQELENQRYRYE